jgi:hypothetical protein
MAKRYNQPYQPVSPEGSSYELRDANETTSLSTLHVSDPIPSVRRLEHSRRMGGRYSGIFWNFVMLTIPMLFFVAVLLGLIFRYRIPFPNLRLLVEPNEGGVYYVRLSSTILVFIASWSSSLAPTLATFAFALVAYPMAGKYLRAAKAERTNDLMTPYQLFLILRFLDGGVFKALWSWLRYTIGWRKHREPQTQSLANIAIVAVLVLILGYAVIPFPFWPN